MSTKIGVTGVTFPDASVQATASPMQAWVNFDATPSTPNIRASYNVSSVTKNFTGNYTVNFTSPLSDANYCVVISGQPSTSGYTRGSGIWNINSTTGGPTGSTQYNPTASAFTVAIEDRLGGSASDTCYCGCIVFR